MSFLNTVPLVWGLEHGPQRHAFELSFEVPAVCADRVAAGDADIGLLPVVEIANMGMDVSPGIGIACRGPVRSILLVSKTPIGAIRTLAVDTSSRTSVQLARVILKRKYGVRPKLVPMAPELAVMLGSADAALVIGDPALHLDPSRLPFETLDLGEEWTGITGLPFVFAAWAGRSEMITDETTRYFLESCRFGLDRIDEIVRIESPRRAMPEALVHEYLTSHIVFELGSREYEGMRLFLEYAGYNDTLRIAGAIAV